MKAFVQVGGQNLGELDQFPERAFPASLAGDLYDEDIPVIPESRFEAVLEENGIDEVVLSYSDVSHDDVMHQASRALSHGCSFRLLGPDDIMLESEDPVIAVDAVRTGTGKSQASQKIAGLCSDRGNDVVVVREPMPYGDLRRQAVQRFASHADLDRADATIEEREEYEKHIENGQVVYAGVDYEKILAEAEDEADIIVWEGGNNELPFFRPDLHIVLTDPHRPGDEVAYHPGETNLRMADYVVVNKENTAEEADIRAVVENITSVNPDAEIIHADSTITVEEPDRIDGKTVLVVEDGPTLTHGDAETGAGKIAAETHGASEIVNPEDSAVGTVKDALETYETGRTLPAMGYSGTQLQDLEETINRADCDLVVSGTPHDLTAVIDVEKPVVQVDYVIQEKGLSFSDVLDRHADLLGDGQR